MWQDVLEWKGLGIPWDICHVNQERSSSGTAASIVRDNSAKVLSSKPAQNID